MFMRQTTILLFLALAPLQASIILRTALTHEKEALPGERYTGVIEISNSADAPQRVHIFKTDFRSTARGESIYDAPTGAGRSNASWIEYSPEYLTLPAKSTMTIPYSVQVPQLDSLAGSYWSVLMVEPEDEIDPLQSQNTLHIHTRIRYAVKVVTMLPFENRELTFLEYKLMQRQGEPFLQVDALSSGTAHFKAVLTLQLFDAVGQPAGTFSAPYQTLFPASSRRFEIALARELAGEYKALLTADCGEDVLYGITFELDLDGTAALDVKAGDVDPDQAIR